MGVFAPALVAIALTWYNAGSAARDALLGRTLAWSVGWRCYAFAVLFFPLARLLAAAVHRAALGTWPAFAAESLPIMIVATIVSAPVQAGEEIGWRGFLLPRLAARVGLPAASILTGIVWAAWHLPFFVLPGSDKTGQPFPAYLAAVTALSVAMAWLYWRTGGSLLLTMIMHAAVNNLRPVSTPSMSGSPFDVAAPFISWAGVGVMWVAAAWLLVAMRGATLTIEAPSARPGSA